MVHTKAHTLSLKDEADVIRYIFLLLVHEKPQTNDMLVHLSTLVKSQ